MQHEDGQDRHARGKEGIVLGWLCWTGLCIESARQVMLWHRVAMIMMITRVSLQRLLGSDRLKEPVLDAR